jgi:ribosome biogenesis GTPase / thiamine phosphate phosphatase
MDLSALGWNDWFAEQFEPYRAQGSTPGRVVSQRHHVYRLYTEAGERLGQIAGKLRHAATGRHDYPAVGDWVAVHAPPQALLRSTIQGILPRKTRFSRKVAGSTTEEQVVAANIDIVFLMAGLDRDFNLRRLDRYLMTALRSGAQPIIILNKADVCAEPLSRAREVEAIAGGVPIHVVSSLRGDGLESLEPYLRPAVTGALLGSSGAGKSTLVNRLAGADIQRVGGLRAADQRGRHTTSHRELIILPSGALLLDTPGLRELQLWDEGDPAPEAFDDIESLAQGCYFRDCRHRSEPRCAVRESVAAGTLPAARLASYHKLQDERQLLAERQKQKSRRR